MSEKTVSLEGYRACIVARMGEEWTSMQLSGSGEDLLATLGTSAGALTEALAERGIRPLAICWNITCMVAKGVTVGLRKAREAQRYGENRKGE